ncbi:hypothetical protein B0T24DRAFT_625322 [Lasiosphaeria ovina]|uniref:Secreted protein n=1 Tax=Lasiosphaeria ovina TaxID=92902 RepID=A0AAE0KDK9_9PEZI|nr:hypothetical protein B0T24DRAFT_625322 [Lasiosphaeria ovina]
MPTSESNGRTVQLSLVLVWCELSFTSSHTVDPSLTCPFRLHFADAPPGNRLRIVYVHLPRQDSSALCVFSVSLAPATVVKVSGTEAMVLQS